MKNLNTLGERIKWARKQAKLSQADVEDKMDIKQSVLSRLETGQLKSTGNLVELADVLRVSSYWLQTGKGSHKTTVQLSKLRDLEIALEKFNLTEEELEFVEKQAINTAMNFFLKK